MGVGVGVNQALQQVSGRRKTSRQTCGTMPPSSGQSLELQLLQDLEKMENAPRAGSNLDGKLTSGSALDAMLVFLRPSCIYEVVPGRSAPAEDMNRKLDADKIIQQTVQKILLKDRTGR